jgi:hypothetical protein
VEHGPGEHHHPDDHAEHQIASPFAHPEKVNHLGEGLP